MDSGDLLDALTIGVFVVDEKLVLTRWNPWLEQHSGISEKQAVGKSLDTLMDIKSLPRLNEAITSALTMGLPSFLSATLNGSVMPLKNPVSGQPVIQSIYVHPLTLDDGAGCLVQVLDETRNHRKEQLLQQQIERLNQTHKALKSANIEAQKAKAAKSMFLSAMSHELKTPLNAIIGFSQVLLQGYTGELNDKQRESIDHVQGAGEKLLMLVENVLYLQDLDTEHPQLDIGAVQLKELFDAVRQNSLAVSEAHQVTLSIEMGQDKMIQGNLRGLCKILQVLISNAVKYNHPGGRVSVSVSSVADDKLLIRVDDNGVGFECEDPMAPFEPFRRLCLENNAYTEGFGIGLTLAKRLADLMDMTLDYQTTLGQGSCFTLAVRVIKP